MTNKSATYMLPLLSKSVPQLLQTELILETYLYNYNNFESYNLHVKIPQSISDDNLSEMMKNPNFVGLMNGPNHRLLTFKLSDRFHDDYDCLLEGKYSKFREDSKNYILQYWTKQVRCKIVPIEFTIKIRDIFDKSKILKNELENKIGVELPDDAELSSIIDLGNEIYGG